MPNFWILINTAPKWTVSWRPWRLPHQMKAPIVNFRQVCSLYPPLRTHFWNLTFPKFISSSSRQIFEINQLPMFSHVLIVNFCLELLSILLYTLTWTICWLRLSDPQNNVDQRLPPAPSVKGKHTVTSDMSHNSRPTLTQVHPRIRTPANVPDVSWYMPLAAMYLQRPLTSRSAPTHKRTPQPCHSMSHRAPRICW